MSMEKMLAWLALVPAIILLSAMIGATFVYFGWNGCHEVLGMRSITFGESFWLAMLSRALLTVTVNGGK